MQDTVRLHARTEFRKRYIRRRLPDDPANGSFTLLGDCKAGADSQQETAHAIFCNVHLSRQMAVGLDYANTLFY
jgi:hypothetical protein